MRTVKTPRWVQNAVRSGKGIEGPNGSKAVGYEWISHLEEAYSDREDGLVGKRVSDWDSALQCSSCGRPIVHVFWVLSPDGSLKPYGREHLHTALGYPRVLSKSRVEGIRRKVVNKELQDSQQKKLHQHYQSIIAARAKQTLEEANWAYTETKHQGQYPLVWLVNPTQKLIMRGDDLAVDRFLENTKGWHVGTPQEFFEAGGRRRASLARRVVARYLQAKIVHPPREVRKFIPQLNKSLSRLKELTKPIALLESLDPDRDEAYYSLDSLLKETTNWEFDRSYVIDLGKAFLRIMERDYAQESLLDFLDASNAYYQQKFLSSGINFLEYLLDDMAPWEKRTQVLRSALPQMKREYRDYAEVTPQHLKAVEEIAEAAGEVADRITAALPKLKELLRWMVAASTGEGSQSVRPKAEDVEVLYHATVNADAIARQGFSRGKEFQTEGIGGATEGISFTSDLYVAKEVMRGLKEAVMIAKGQVRLHHVMDWIRRDHLEEDVLASFKSSRGLPPKDTPEDVFNLYARWMTFQSKRYNPLFFGVDERVLNAWKSKNPRKVGIIVAQVDMTDPKIKYLPSMHEYRVPPESVLKIEKVIR